MSFSLKQNSNKKMNDLALKFNVFLQDYMTRIVEGDMFYELNDE